MTILTKLFRFMDQDNKTKQRIETLETLLQALNEKRSKCREHQKPETGSSQMEALEEECRILKMIIAKGEKRLLRLSSSLDN